MYNILICSPIQRRDSSAAMHRILHGGGYTVAFAFLDSGAKARSALYESFSGRPPDALVADLSDAMDCLPLRYLTRMLHDTWGDDTPLPPRLTVLTSHHLAQPDWPAYTDDFLLSPFSPDELLARLNQLGFRNRHRNGADCLNVADVKIDLAGAQAVDSEANPLRLTPREFELLRFLAMHRGKFFSRDRLLDMVWSVDFEGGERTVDIHIRRLRAKLSPQASALLETRRGFGYRLLYSA